jgi:hypothetical protein
MSAIKLATLLVGLAVCRVAAVTIDFEWLTVYALGKHSISTRHFTLYPSYSSSHPSQLSTPQSNCWTLVILQAVPPSKLSQIYPPLC